MVLRGLLVLRQSSLHFIYCSSFHFASHFTSFTSWTLSKRAIFVYQKGVFLFWLSGYNVFFFRAGGWSSRRILGKGNEFSFGGRSFREVDPGEKKRRRREK